MAVGAYGTLQTHQALLRSACLLSGTVPQLCTATPCSLSGAPSVVCPPGDLADSYSGSTPRPAPQPWSSHTAPEAPLCLSRCSAHLLHGMCQGQEYCVSCLHCVSHLTRPGSELLLRSSWELTDRHSRLSRGLNTHLSVHSSNTGDLHILPRHSNIPSRKTRKRNDCTHLKGASIRWSGHGQCPPGRAQARRCALLQLCSGKPLRKKELSVLM